jgi:arginine N-succinyltransferase
LLVTELDPDNDGRPAHAMLLADGFRDEGYVNIFDGGPAFVAPIDEVAKITARREATYLGEKPCGTPRLIATGHAQDFRLLGGGVSSDDDRVKLDPSAEGHPAFRAAKHSTSHQRRPAHND